MGKGEKFGPEYAADLVNECIGTSRRRDGVRRNNTERGGRKRQIPRTDRTDLPSGSIPQCGGHCFHFIPDMSEKTVKCRIQSPDCELYIPRSISSHVIS